MKRLSLYTLIYAVVMLVFFLLLVFLRIPFPAYPLMSWQDALDILTPLVLIPLYWVLFLYSTKDTPSVSDEIAFCVLSAMLAAGNGMHLSANSVNNLAENLAQQQVIDILGTDIYKLTYFFDEHLSHFLIHLGVMGLAALLIFHENRNPAGYKTFWSLTVPAGILSGFSLFAMFLEGQTTVIGFPYLLIMTLIILVWGRRKLGGQPILAFFFIAFCLASALFIGWGLYYGGFPQFSEVGLI